MTILNKKKVRDSQKISTVAVMMKGIIRKKSQDIYKLKQNISNNY